MAIVIHEFLIPTPSGSPPRASKTVALPTGTQLLGVINPDGAPLLVVRADTAQATQDRVIVAVRKDVPLTAAEQAATYVGSFKGYVVTPGGQAEIYHLLAL